MNETLSQKQRRFARAVPRLLDFIHSLPGHEATLGDAFRDPRVFGVIGVSLGYGHASSAHKNKLALDINLFINDVFQEGTEAHRVIGEWWEKQYSDCRWGGRFQDGNHYSIEHNGFR